MGRKVVEVKAAHCTGVWGTLPQKIVKFRDSEMPFAEFFAGHFQYINTQENAMATVSVKIIGTFLCLLVPSMLVYMIWSLNSNKQRWEGKGKHGKGKKGVCVKCPNYSCPRLELFIYPSLVLFVSFGVYVKKRGQ